jgi:hypothetical protein
MRRISAPVALLGLLAIAMSWSPAVNAIPAFARQLDKACSTCHEAIPRLNEAGRTYRANGYRFLEDTRWPEAWKLSTLPFSVEVELEAFWNKDTDSEGVSAPTVSDTKVEEIELLAATALGENGKVSVFGSLAVLQEEENGETHYVSELGTAFIQINDLLGGTGRGRFNLRAGQWGVALPFLADNQSIIANNYLAQSALGVLGDGAQRSVELNGQLFSNGDTVVHRYAAGVSRTEFAGEPDRISKYDPYFTYAVNWLERYNLGLIYRATRAEGLTATDSQSIERYGIAGAADIGPTTLTLGYFKADPEIGLSSDDVLGELLWFAGRKAVFGARYERVSRDGAADDATAVSLTARYNVLQNAFGVLEYRMRDDTSNIVGSSDEQRRWRLILTLLF